MARKSRKHVQVDTVEKTTSFKTAIYARLSIEDREAESLDNQIQLIKNYISQRDDMTLCNVFFDNGQTGTNFNRPGFESLMDEVRLGKIDCIVVKDLSRFGRDYVEAGSYIEIIFPRLGVRFISIGDNYDSHDPRCRGEGMSIALKNMINSFYSKDIATKIRSSFKVRKQRGDFIGKVPPFGYIKSPADRNKLAVDDKAAAIVRRIFQMRLDGMGESNIALTLSKEGVHTPGHYGYLNGLNREKRYSQPSFWDTKTITDILTNVSYLGHVATGKTVTENGKQRWLPRDEWRVVENTHEPIISQGDFDAVAALRRETKDRYDSQNRHKREHLPENIFKGIIFCSDCGRSYRRITNTHRDRVTYRLTYICAYCNQHSPKYTYRHFRKDDLYDAIFELIRMQIDLCMESRDKLLAVQSSDTAKRNRDSIAEQTLQAERRIEYLSTMRLKAYDDYCACLLDKNEYRILCKQYDDEKAEREKLISNLNMQAAVLTPEPIENNRYINAFQQFIDSKELTRELLLALVKRIEISGDRSIHVIFRFQDEYAQILRQIEESEVQLYEE